VTETPAFAASLLREARRRAGLSQVELAGRAGVTQSVVSAYESGARQPSLPTLKRLVEATGFELGVDIRGAPSRIDRLPGPIGRRIRDHRHQLKQLAAAHGVSNLRVFGSVARGEETANSDLDLLVDVSPEVGLLGLARLQRELETVLQARVDLVPAGDLKPAIRGEVDSELVAL
jgi:predicted nucleotidyltransferase/DNA-binding XRE family transcriptional regulator